MTSTETMLKPTIGSRGEVVLSRSRVSVGPRGEILFNGDGGATVIKPGGGSGCIEGNGG